MTQIRSLSEVQGIHKIWRQDMIKPTTPHHHNPVYTGGSCFLRVGKARFSSSPPHRSQCSLPRSQLSHLDLLSSPARGLGGPMSSDGISLRLFRTQLSCHLLRSASLPQTPQHTLLYSFTSPPRCTMMWRA